MVIAKSYSIFLWLVILFLLILLIYGFCSENYAVHINSTLKTILQTY